MKILVKIVFFVVTVILAGCIEPYSPDLKGDDKDAYVVTGEVTNHEGYQLVSVTKAAPIGQPVHIPVTGGVLSIEDDQGHIFNMEEYASGEYRVWIDQQFLHPGTSYRLHMLLPDGKEILSEYDMMHSCPAMDSVYYKRVDMISPEFGTNMKAIQFYTDLHGSETDSRYYRWSALETWEHHSPWPIEYYYDGKLNTVHPWDYSLSVCWVTRPYTRVTTLSTANLVTNDCSMVPINFVDNTTTKLYCGYSVLITQHALSEAAYNYREQLRINNDHQGGLYEMQPLPVAGNLKNLTDPGKKVLGFFEACGTSEKRIFIDAVRDMGIYYDSICAPYPLDRLEWKPYTRADYPVYMVMYKNVRLLVDPHCVDCRYSGGVLEKPEFWPK